MAHVLTTLKSAIIITIIRFYGVCYGHIKFSNNFNDKTVFMTFVMAALRSAIVSMIILFYGLCFDHIKISNNYNDNPVLWPLLRPH